MGMGNRSDSRTGPGSAGAGCGFRVRWQPVGGAPPLRSGCDIGQACPQANPASGGGDGVTVQTVDVFQQDVVTVPGGGRFFTVRQTFIDFLTQAGPPDVLRLDWGGGAVDVPLPEFIADGARLNTYFGAVIGWPAPGGATVV